MMSWNELSMIGLVATLIAMLTLSPPPPRYRAISIDWRAIAEAPSWQQSAPPGDVQLFLGP